MSKIHKTAVIEDGAQIGEDVEIGPYCIVGKDVSIGAGSRLHSHVVISGKTTIGEGNQFYHHAVIGEEPQDLKYMQGQTSLSIGSNNIFRENVAIHVGTEAGGGNTGIGNRNLIMGHCHIAHDCQLGDENVLANSVLLAGHVCLENNVRIGGLSAVVQFKRIGSYSFLGGGSIIGSDICPFSAGYGNRFRVKGVNIIGLKRAGFSREEIKTIMKAHALLFRTSNPMSSSIEALRSMNQENPNRHIESILNFYSKVSF